jgi:hypothetical protein
MAAAATGGGSPISRAAGQQSNKHAKAPAPSPSPPRPAAGALAKDLARSGARREVRSLGRKLLWPAVVLALAFILTFVDMFTAGETGGFLMLGPIRVRWIAGLLALAGIGLAIWNVVVGQDD